MTKKDEIKKDIKIYKEMENLANSDGGKQLKELLLSEIITSVDTIAQSYKTLSHVEFIAQGARLHERLNLYRLITNAKKQVKSAELALKEVLDHDED